MIKGLGEKIPNIHKDCFVAEILQQLLEMWLLKKIHLYGMAFV